MEEKIIKNSHQNNLQVKAELQNFMFCPRCGHTVIGENMNGFCGNCGYRFCPSCSE